MNRRYRLLLLGTHPVQYSAQLFRELAQHPQLEILVAYCSLQGAEAGLDPDFGVKVAWDVPRHFHSEIRIETRLGSL